MMYHEDEDFSMEKVDPCFSKIITLYGPYAHKPTLLWPLIKLTCDLVKALPTEKLFQMFFNIIEIIKPLIVSLEEDNDIIICGMCDLITQMLGSLEGYNINP